MNLQYDKDFLSKLDRCKNKITYARITALQFDETPIEYIEGRVTQGSINIDGDSAVRRTCSLSLVAQNFNYNDYYWGLNTKFKLEVGLKNSVDSLYPDIIWFNQGIYLITSFNTSHSTSGFNISISGKDKMCLLNGEVGGSLESTVDFGQIEEETADGVWTIRKIPIPEIIRNMVHVYAGEPYWNIIINDLDTYGLELLEYRYDIPMYLYRNSDSLVFNNAFLENNRQVIYSKQEDGSFKGKKLKDLQPTDLDLLVDALTDSPAPPKLYIQYDSMPEGKEESAEEYNGKYYVPYIFAKVEYGQTAGYRITDLVYAGDLIANVGESITSVLDKIKNMLIEFEYFYDIEGHFVFQKKQSFLNTLWTPTSKDDWHGEEVTEALVHSSSSIYTFSGGELISSFNNTPNLLNMRNDYSIWGERTGMSGASIPIHMRYAIDNKPTHYKRIYVANDDPWLLEYNNKYGTSLKGFEEEKTYRTEDKWASQDLGELNNTIALNGQNGKMDTRTDESEYVVSEKYNVLGQKTVKISGWAYWDPDDGQQQFSLYTFYDEEGNIVAFQKATFSYSEGGNLLTDEEIVVPEGATHIRIAGHVKEGMPGLKFFQEEGYDWREIIYQMALDYYRYNTFDDFEIRLAKANPHFPSGQTGYESYYIDMQGFWRQLYNPDIQQEIENLEEEKVTGYETLNSLKSTIKAQEQKLSALKQKIVDNEITDEEYSDFIKTSKDLTDSRTQLELLENQVDVNDQKLEKLKKDKLNYYYPGDDDYTNDHKYWNRAVFEAPETLNFWFDFLDTPGELQQFNVKNVGSRSKSINDTSIKSIYFRETPKVVFTTNITEEEWLTGYKYIQVPSVNVDTMFSISGQGKSAKNKLDELLYHHGYCIESASITAIPIYYLEPNSRIYLYDEKSGLNGDYVMTKISLPLTFNGTMNIVATKAVTTLF